MTGIRTVILFAVGALVGLLGDACQIASGVTAYAPTSWPKLWLSPLWFPLVCGAGVVGAAFGGRGLGLPSRARSPHQAAAAILAMTALYASTGMLPSQVMIMPVVLMGALALLTWCVWDPSLRCLALALVSSAIATLTEGVFAHAGTHRYAPGSDGLFGLAPWLPSLFFALAVVASGLWNSLFAERGVERER